MESCAQDLTTIDGVRSYLFKTPFQAAKIMALGGGAINFTYRIILENPYTLPSLADGTPGSTIFTAVLKHAEPFPATYRSFPFDVERQKYEIIAYSEIPKIVSSSSILYLPKLYYTDPQYHVFIMEDCGVKGTDLKEHLRYKSLPVHTARLIGNDLGQFLAEIHLASHESQATDSPAVQLKHVFSNNRSGRSFSARITYGVILDKLPPTFPHAEQIRALAEKMQERFMTTDEVLAPGDLSPRNLLVESEGESVKRVGIVDWELVRPGFPGADIGEFMAELYALRTFYPWCSETVDVLGSAFIARYKSIISMSEGKPLKLEDIAKSALIHAGAQLFGVTRFAQPKWGSDEEIQRISLQGLEIFLAGDDAGNSSEWYRKCLLEPLLN